MKYQWKQRIRYSEVDGERKLTIPNLVNYFKTAVPFSQKNLESDVNIWRSIRKHGYCLSGRL